MIRKPTILKLHRWLGLAVGLLFLVQGLTGATLVFRDELEAAVQPSLVVAERPARLPVQALLDSFRAAHPDADLSRAEFPNAANQAVIFKWAQKKERGLTAIDPFNGRVVRDGPASAWPLEWVFNLHEQLLAGPVGETLIGIEGLVLLFMAVTGLIYWWPGARRLKQGFRVKLDGSADLRWRTLHRAVGAGVALILIMSATTGVLMVWKDNVRDVLGAVATVDRKPAPKVAKLPGAAMLPIDALIAKAGVASGGTTFRQLRFSSGGRVVAIYLDSNRTIRADGTTQIYFNRYTGAEVGRYVAGTTSAPSEAIDWLFTFHTGLWGGVITRALMVLVGLTLAGMAASGLWLWYSRTRRKKRAPATQRKAA